MATADWQDLYWKTLNNAKILKMERDILKEAAEGKDKEIRNLEFENKSLKRTNDFLEMKIETLDNILEDEDDTINRLKGVLDNMKMDSPDFARGFNAGKDSTLRRNPSGCVCKFSEDEDRIISICSAHEELIDEIVEKKLWPYDVWKKEKGKNENENLDGT